MATSLLWDRTLLCPAKVSVPKLLTNNTSGGIGIGSGTEQIVGNTPPRWGLKLSDIPLNTPDRIRAWNLMKGLTQGRLIPFMAPLFDRNRAPTTPSTVTLAEHVYSGQVAFSVEELALGGSIAAGMHFQLEESIYLVTSMGPGTPGGGSAIFPITITPPLRSASIEGVHCHFDDPWFRARLATDGEMNDVDLEVKKSGVGAVNLVEDA